VVGSTREIRLRVNGKKYLEVPDGHRTTFVVGALDMLCFAYLYAAPEHKARIDAMVGYAGKYESDALRHKFDDYMRNVKDPENHGAAARLFVALNEWCGVDKA
jgi:hypothetical protein